MRAANLERITLSSSNIKATGCLALIRSNWAKISVIDLSNYVLTKTPIKLEIKGAFICRRPTGI